jgi:hypothetical protein
VSHQTRLAALLLSWSSLLPLPSQLLLLSPLPLGSPKVNALSLPLPLPLPL